MAHSVYKKALQTRAGHLVQAILAVLFVCGVSIADTQTPSQGEEDKIYITSDLLVSDANSQTAEFIGNVRAVQADTTMTTDRLKVFY